MKWRVSTATPQLGTYWLGVDDKPELIGVSMLPCDETRLGFQRAQAIAVGCVYAWDPELSTFRRGCEGDAP